MFGCIGKLSTAASGGAEQSIYVHSTVVLFLINTAKTNITVLRLVSKSDRVQSCTFVEK